MPLPFFMSGALFTGVASGIWSYNRENYMWDWQNRQARDFQIQNMLVSRFGLFREDIRDLAALTTSKMDSYLVVNTLKLGFIVSVFFNYDRTDTPMAKGTTAEQQFSLLFSVCFMTAFQLLLTSVWFSMHASVVAQSFMTKMLLQTVRIPFPTDQDISATAPEARDYERDLSTAFRIPLMRAAPPAAASGAAGAGGTAASMSRRTSQVSSQSQSQPSVSRASTSLPPMPSLGSVNAQWPGASPKEPSRPSSRPSSRDEAGWRARVQPPILQEDPLPRREEEDEISSQLGLPPPSDASAPGQSRSAGQAANLAPHLKFYGLVMSNWQPFDLYSKICMSIGTSAMLSGIAYYAIFYTRSSPTEHSTINAATEGWYTFLFMSVLAWWSVTLDLILSPLEHIFAAILALGAPACVILLSLTDDRSLWLLPVAVLLQSMWVWFLCGSAVLLQDGWPRRWRASLFLNILAVDGAARAAPSSRWASPRRGEASRSSACRMQALELLQCLRAAAELPMPDMAAEEVRSTCARLEEATAGPPQTGPPDGGGGGATPAGDGGFWLVLPAQDGGAPRTHWIRSPSCAGLGSGRPGATQAASLEELLGAAHSALAALILDAPVDAWTAEDAEQLAQYGGNMDGSTIEGFERQFRTKGYNSRSSMGKTAHNFFRASAGFVCASWLTAVVATVCMDHHHKGHGDRKPSGVQLAAAELSAFFGQALFPWLSPEPAAVAVARALSSEPLLPPRPWYAPSALSCSADGRLLALADGVRAFARAANGSWLGPFAACGGGDVAAVAFAPGGEDEEEDRERRGPALVAAGAGGAFPLPRWPDEAEHCEAGVWTSSSAASSSTAPGPSSLALDGAADDGRGGLRGLAVRDGQLVALEASAAGAWEVAGALPLPVRGPRRWAGVALHAGTGLALDEGGFVFVLDAAAGEWAGPWRLEAPDLAWRGICLVSGGGGHRSWLALGERQADGAGGPQRRRLELWRFEPPDERGVDGEGGIAAGAGAPGLAEIA